MTARGLMGTIAVAAGGLLLTVTGAEAQLDWGSASTVETAGDDITLIYTQVSVQPDRRGWIPIASLSVYRLDTPGGGTWSGTPAVGMKYRASTGMVSGKIGYSFQDEENVFPFFGGSGRGISTSVHAEHWGTGRFGLQGIGSYNWGSDYLWSRGRATARVADLEPGSVHLGGEAVWQGQMEDPVIGEGYQATQLGPVVQFISRNDGPIVALGGGWKDDNVGTESTWYAKAELVLSF